jgi:hypothetical protein
VLFAGLMFVVLREFEIGFSGLGLRPEVKIISLTDNGSVLCRARLIEGRTEGERLTITNAFVETT